MSDIEIRAPREDEFPAILAVGSLAFGEEPAPEDEKAYQLGFPFERALCAYEDGNVVATSAVYSLELTLPGHTALPAGGVTWIATLPTHRRRGLLRRLMAAHFSDMAARCEPLSALFASEGHIYGRFGYGPATSSLSFSIERSHAGCAVPPEDEGRITMLSTEQAAAELPVIYESLRLVHPGTVSRPAQYWAGYLADPPGARGGAGRLYHARHETTPGIPDGYVSYRIKCEWGASSLPMNELKVVELVAAGPDAYKALWAYMLNTDLCRTISSWRARPDEPLRWLLADHRRFEVKALADDLYVRLLDIPRALGARAYGAAGVLVLQVCDVFPAVHKARYLLQSHTAGAPTGECSRTTRKPDLELRADHLAAAYLGGVSFTTLAAAGWVRELTPGALARADAMFSTGVAPHCSTEF